MTMIKKYKNYKCWGDFRHSSVGKESACNAGDLGLIPGLGRFPGEGKGYPLQYSGLENSMDCYSPWGCKELDRTELLSLSLFILVSCVFTIVISSGIDPLIIMQCLISYLITVST